MSPAKDHLRRSPIREEGLKSSSSEESNEGKKASSAPIAISKQSPEYEESEDNQKPSVSPPGFSFSSNVSTRFEFLLFAFPLYF